MFLYGICDVLYKLPTSFQNIFSFGLWCSMCIKHHQFNMELETKSQRDNGEAIYVVCIST